MLKKMKKKLKAHFEKMRVEDETLEELRKKAKWHKELNEKSSLRDR